MRPIGELLKELGFNKEAPLGTQKAFFRHLVQHAEMVRIQNSRMENEISEKPETEYDRKFDATFI